MAEDRESESWWVPLLVVATVLLAYSPVYTAEFWFHDDWWHITGTPWQPGSFPMSSLVSALGRPLGNQCLVVYFSLADMMGSSAGGRFLAVLTILAFGASQFWFLRLQGLSRGVAAALGGGMALLPGVLACSFWLAAAYIVVGLIVSTLAAIAIHLAQAEGRGFLGRAGLLGVAFVLQLGNLFVHQTSGMHLWVLVACAAAVDAVEDTRRAVRRMGPYLLLGVSTMVVYLLWFKVFAGMEERLVAVDPTRRTTFDLAQLAVTFRWFFDAALPRAASLWVVGAPSWVPSLVLVVFLGSLGAFTRHLVVAQRATGDRLATALAWVYPLGVLGFALLTYSTMLITVFRFHAYRTVISLSSLLLVLTVVHLALLAGRRGASPRPPPWALATTVLVVGSLAWHTLSAHMVGPALVEIEILSRELRAASSRGATAVHLLYPPILDVQYTDEMMVPTTAFPHNVSYMLKGLSRQLGLPEPSVTCAAGGPPPEEGVYVIEEAAEDAYVIDMTKETQRGPWLQCHPPSSGYAGP